MADEEAVPDVLLTFRDGQGREWLAAGFLGELARYPELGRPAAEKRSIHSFLDEDIKLTDFKVIEPPHVPD